MRVHKECVYPSTTKDLRELIGAILKWEDKAMMSERPAGTVIPPIWRMAVFLELCPESVREQ
eukprot:7550916-Lingulodinium_polyedra.AAC.1